MTDTRKPLAKSLHTITVLVAIARLHERAGVGANLLDADPARDRQIAAALETLGYAGAPDPYGLAARARAIIGKA